MRLSLAAACLAFMAGLVGQPALSAPPAQPLPRDGSCPGGYYASGNYCVPNANGRYAISRNGSCPSGYHSSGNYCVASSDNSKLAIHRKGSCPGGFYASGNYCVSSK